MRYICASVTLLLSAAAVVYGVLGVSDVSAFFTAGAVAALLASKRGW